jgi:hypothetical protein
MFLGYLSRTASRYKFVTLADYDNRYSTEDNSNSDNDSDSDSNSNREDEYHQLVLASGKITPTESATDDQFLGFSHLNLNSLYLTLVFGNSTPHLSKWFSFYCDARKYAHELIDNKVENLKIESIQVCCIPLPRTCIEWKVRIDVLKDLLCMCMCTCTISSLSLLIISYLGEKNAKFEVLKRYDVRSLVLQDLRRKSIKLGKEIKFAAVEINQVSKEIQTAGEKIRQLGKEIDDAYACEKYMLPQ